MKKRISNPHQDFANLLLIVLKFLLVIIIGLQGLLRQLGLEPDQITGIVNATPSEQLSEGEFQLSFYALYYAPGADFEVVNYRLEVTPWKCWQVCAIGSEDWDALKASELESGNGESHLPVSWVKLETRHLTKHGKPDPSLSQTEQPTPPEGDGEQSGLLGTSQDQASSNDSTLQESPGKRPSEIFNQVFQLKASDEERDPSQGTYQVVYRVTFVEEDNSGKRTSHWVRDSGGQGFRVIYSPGEEEWRLAPIQIVRGRWAELPQELRAFQVATADSDTRLEIRNSNGTPLLQVKNYRGLTINSFEERLRITTRVGSKSVLEDYFEIAAANQRVGVSDAKLQRFDPVSGNYVRGEFKDLSAGDAVYFELADGDGTDASLVRYGSEVMAKVPVVIEENLPPRSVYRGRGGDTDTRVALYFPLNAEYSIVNNSAGNTWYFNLNKFIIDPDGLRQGAPSLHIPFRNIVPRGNWLTRYDLVRDNSTGDTFLMVDPSNLAFPPSGELSENLGLSISDEWNRSVAITVQVRYLRPEQVDLLRAAVSQAPR